MKDKQVERIMAVVLRVWEKRYGKENLSPEAILAVREVLESSPHEDGLMPITLIEDGKTYYVPIEDIILNGMTSEEVTNYPKTKEYKSKVEKND